MYFPSQFANIFFTYKTFVINLHLLRVEYQYRPTGFRYRLLVLPDYIFASEIERYLFRKMRIVSWSITIQQLICETSLVVLRPIYIYPFLVKSRNQKIVTGGDKLGLPLYN